MNPREFVSAFSVKYPNKGVYSVIPFSSGKVLDIQFHIDRLIGSLNTLRKYEASQDLSSLNIDRSQFHNSFYQSLQHLETDIVWRSTESINDKSILTVCSTYDNGDYIFESLISLSQPYKIFESLLDFVDVSLIEYRKRIPTAKYCEWTNERKYIEDRIISPKNETLMYSHSSMNLMELTEGLISNIIVVDSNDRFVRPQRNLALDGSMLKLIQQCFLHIETSCYEESIQLSSLNGLKAMFIASEYFT